MEPEHKFKPGDRVRCNWSRGNQRLFATVLAAKCGDAVRIRFDWGEGSDPQGTFYPASYLEPLPPSEDPRRSPSDVETIEKLRRENEELRAKLEIALNNAPKDACNYSKLKDRNVDLRAKLAAAELDACSELRDVLAAPSMHACVTSARELRAKLARAEAEVRRSHDAEAAAAILLSEARKPTAPPSADHEQRIAALETECGIGLAGVGEFRLPNLPERIAAMELWRKEQKDDQ
jgi:hypothetical protein